MPKTPRDFSQGLIYSIVCKTDASLLYVGSTTNLTQRKNTHKTACINEKSKIHNLQVYVMIRANGGWDNFKMTPVKEFPCDNNIQLRIEEERIRVELQANLNTNRAYRTQQEYHKDWYQINKEVKNEYTKEYYETHKEASQEYHKEWYQINKEVIKVQQKEYYQTHKEAKSEYQRNYLQNKEKKKINCGCGSVVLDRCMYLHLGCKKHLKFLALTDVKA